MPRSKTCQFIGTDKLAKIGILISRGNSYDWPIVSTTRKEFRCISNSVRVSNNSFRFRSDKNNMANMTIVIKLIVANYDAGDVLSSSVL